MKKLLLSSVFALSLAAFASSALAAGAAPGANGSTLTPQTTVCSADPVCASFGGGYVCSPVSHTCVSPAGSTCTVNPGCANYGPTFVCQNNTCVNPGAAVAGATCSPTDTVNKCGLGNVCQRDVAGDGFYKCFVAPASTGSKSCTGVNDVTSCASTESCQQNASGAYQCFSKENAGIAAPPSANSSTGFVPLAPIPGLDDSASSASTAGLAQFFNNLYKYLIGIAAVLAVVQITRGGLEYATQDSVSKKSDGKNHIEQAILGLVLVLAPALVFSLINPSILDLSLNLPALNTASGTSTPTAVIDTGIACNGNDCSAAQNTCQALLAKNDGWSANTSTVTKVCMKNGKVDPDHPNGDDIDSGGEAGPTPNPCPAGDTTVLQCQGAGNANGAGQAGLSVADIAGGASAPFDGSYMDLVKFTGAGAQQKAQGYRCQTTQQKSKSVFSSTDQTIWYSMCLTPRLDYLELSASELGHINIPSQNAYDTYNGECKAISSAQTSEGFGGVKLLVDQIVNPQKTGSCAVAPNPDVPATCLAAYSTCTP